MKKKLYTLDDLYDFFVNHNSDVKFDSQQDNDQIVVQLQGNIDFSNEQSEKNTEGLMPVVLRACHTKLNKNKSNIDKEVMEAALPSFANRPILGFIHYVNDEPCFWSHNMHEDENGEIVYDEIPVGIICESCNAHLEHDEEENVDRVVVNGYIFEEYSKASEIILREEKLDVSVELSIRELSYNAHDKYLDIKDFYFSGVTILQCDDEGNKVLPGMEGSNIQLADFSRDNNRLVQFNKDEKLIEVLDKLNTTLSKFNINNDNSGKEDERVEKKENFEEVTEITEEVTETEETTEEEVVVTENESEETVEEASEDETVEEESEVIEETEAIETIEELNYEKMVRSYEVSHEDVKYALYNLLAPYEESDNEWYYITSVYDTYFAYENWEGTKLYGQKYTKDGDIVAFDGDRYTLHKEYLTDSEYVELQNMRANYASLVSFKAEVESKELHAQREEIINSEKYAVLSEKNESGEYVNESFAELVSEMDNYSLADLETKIKVMHSEYIVEHSTFATTVEEPVVTKKQFANPSSEDVKPSRYGNLFSK